MVRKALVGLASMLLVTLGMLGLASPAQAAGYKLQNMCWSTNHGVYSYSQWGTWDWVACGSYRNYSIGVQSPYPMRVITNGNDVCYRPNTTARFQTNAIAYTVPGC